MGMKKLEDKSQRLIRVMKTIFFLITLSISFLLISAPIFLVIADALLPAALLSASLSSSSTSSTGIGTFPSSSFSNNNNNSPLFSHKTLSSCFHNYDFRYSLIDIPSISIIRSIIIICVYSCCDGPRRSRGPYLWATTMCSLLSLIFVSFKASFVFGINNNNTTTTTGGGGVGGRGGGVSSGTEVALFVSSYALAVGHVVVAYRICCRERKKLLVYKIDIEAVSACKNGFPIYQKLLQQQRMK